VDKLLKGKNLTICFVFVFIKIIFYLLKNFQTKSMHLIVYSILNTWPPEPNSKEQSGTSFHQSAQK